MKGEILTAADLLRITTRVIRRDYFREYRSVHRGQMNEAARICMAKLRGTSVDSIDEKKELLKTETLQSLCMRGCCFDRRVTRSGNFRKIEP